MKTKTGLWIDHSKAIIVKITDNKEEIKLITSEVEKQLRRSGDSILKGSYEPLQVPADDSRQKAFTGNLNIYYDEIIAYLCDYKSILIFGPGEAKGELKKRFEEMNLSGLIAGVETANKMTDAQITAKVREFFK